MADVNNKKVKLNLVCKNYVYIQKKIQLYQNQKGVGHLQKVKLDTF